MTFKGPTNVQHGAAALGPMFYCQGWIRQILSPTPLVWHNGGTPGSKAVAGFTPEGDLGVVVLSNLDGTGLPEALMYYLYDLYYGRPVKDYTAMFLADAKALAAPPSTPPATPAPARALSAYAGSYENPYFGQLTVEPQEGTLVLKVGPRQTLVRARHWDGDTFAIALAGYGVPKYTDGFVSFQFGQGERATDLRFIRALDDAADGRFTRTAGP